MYNFVRYDNKYLSSLVKLLDESFHIQNKHKEDLVSWKLHDPFLKNKTITYLALDQNQKVIGHYSNIPVTVTHNSNTHSCMICVDMTSATAHRGKGLITELAKRVYEDVQKNNCDFSLGFSNDEGVQVDKNSSRYGYEVVGKFVRYFKIIILRKNISIHLEKVTDFNKDFFLYPSSFFRIEKNYNQLHWRYIKKPNSEYDVYAIKEGVKVIGYVVLSFVNKKCYVYDIISSDTTKKLMISILRSIENISLEKNIRLVIYNVLDNEYWKQLFNRYKYFKKENNTVNYFLTVKIHTNTTPREIILNKENWLLMNGDIL